MKTHLITLAVPHDEHTDASHTTQFAARAIPGSHVLNTEVVEADIFEAEWNEEAPALPMSVADAEQLMDDDGYISVVVAIDQDAFLDAARSAGGDTVIEDGVHPLVFDFGFAVAASATIVGVQGEQLLVLYSTCIAETLDD